MLPSPVRQYLDDNRQRHLQKLLELLRLPSIANVSGPADACPAAAGWLAEHLRGLGLNARLVQTQGKPVVLASIHVSDDAPTVLLYGHYDVQPAEPLELWETDPFEPVVRDGAVYARGADDDKGQLFAHLMALEAWQRAGGGLPANVKVLLEGEEEIGSPHLEAFMAGHADELAADAAVISDSEFFAPGMPAITYSFRGLAYFELAVSGPSQDLHSGQHGGAVPNPINALARIVAAMHDDRGRVAIDGFYDDVLALDAEERQAWAKLPFDERQYARSLGVEALSGGEAGYSALERRWARPALDCNGIFGGYMAAGQKTIIPASAGAKLSMRLVSDQDPRKVAQALERFVRRHTPAGLRSRVDVHAASRPVTLSRSTPAMRAAAAALELAFGRAPVFVRCGASVPAVEMLHRLLGLPVVPMGLGLPDDNLHGPNEHMHLEQLWGGSLAAAALLANLAEAK